MLAQRQILNSKIQHNWGHCSDEGQCDNAGDSDSYDFHMYIDNRAQKHFRDKSQFAKSLMSGLQRNQAHLSPVSKMSH